MGCHGEVEDISWDGPLLHGSEVHTFSGDSMAIHCIVGKEIGHKCISYSEDVIYWACPCSGNCIAIWDSPALYLDNAPAHITCSDGGVTGPDTISLLSSTVGAHDEGNCSSSEGERFSNV